MPKGIKTIEWTEKNDITLFLTILSVHDIKIDVGKVAEAFGRGADRQCISNRMAKLRKKAADNGIESGEKATTTAKSKATASKRASGGGKKPGKGAKRGRGKAANDMSDDEESVEVKEETEGDKESTPPTSDATVNGLSPPRTPKQHQNIQKTIGGRVTKPRSSPRKPAKKDYKNLTDPFKTMNDTDHDGEKIFDTDKSDSENTVSDDDFGKDAAHMALKEEEATMMEA